jgi:hypothetical protein
LCGSPHDHTNRSSRIINHLQNNKISGVYTNHLQEDTTSVVDINYRQHDTATAHIHGSSVDAVDAKITVQVDIYLTERRNKDEYIVLFIQALQKN